MKNPGLWQYLRAAFNARPLGMPLPPNWAAVAAFGMLGVLNPGFWILGAAAELAYLMLLAGNRRFQKWVDATSLADSNLAERVRLDQALARLAPGDRRLYQAFEERCQRVARQQLEVDTKADTSGLGEGLGKLRSLYLQLLLLRRKFQIGLAEGAEREAGGAPGVNPPGPGPLDARILALQERLNQPVGDDLRRSLQGQLEILESRRRQQREAREKLAFIEAELVRIQEQVTLVFEQTLTASEPASLSQRIDSVSASLEGTTTWIRDQQQIYGRIEEIFDDPAPVRVPPQAKAAE